MITINALVSFSFFLFCLVNGVVLAFIIKYAFSQSLISYPELENNVTIGWLNCRFYSFLGNPYTEKCWQTNYPFNVTIKAGL